MGRGIFRSGPGALLTPDQLAANFSLPVYRIVTGSAQVTFPNQDRGKQSSYVLLTGTNSSVHSDINWLANFPLTLNWFQWESVIVPVLLDPRVSGWSGVLRSNGKPCYLSNTIVGPTGQVAQTTSGLVLEQGVEIGTEVLGTTGITRLLGVLEYVELISGLIRTRAEGVRAT
jgi:hypothetical protein